MQKMSKLDIGALISEMARFGINLDGNCKNSTQIQPLELKLSAVYITRSCASPGMLFASTFFTDEKIGQLKKQVHFLKFFCPRRALPWLVKALKIRQVPIFKFLGPRRAPPWLVKALNLQPL